MSRDPALACLASLRAAISLLEKGGKKAAASDEMFAQMLADYRRAADEFAATLAQHMGEKAYRCKGCGWRGDSPIASDHPQNGCDLELMVPNKPITPSQGLDAATVERCAQACDAIAETARANGAAFVAAGAEHAGHAVRALAIDPHQHGGKGA